MTARAPIFSLTRCALSLCATTAAGVLALAAGCGADERAAADARTEPAQTSVVSGDRAATMSAIAESPSGGDQDASDSQAGGALDTGNGGNLSGAKPARRSPDEASSPPAAPGLAAGGAGDKLGEFELTYYVIAREPQPKQTDERVVIRDAECEPIAKVSRRFARDLRLQGSGILRDGRPVTAARRCDCDPGGVCFSALEERYRFGVGARGHALSPFRSVAVDPEVVSLGRTLYIPEFDGLKMPGRPPHGGFVHDGCVVADDRGGNVSGRQLDFFTVRRGYYRALLRAHGLTEVTVYDGAERCGDELAAGRRPTS